jgi:hypothetical protein
MYGILIRIIFPDCNCCTGYTCNSARCCRKADENPPPSARAFLAFPLIVAGIVFGEDRLIGYCLMDAGFLLAFIDIIVRHRNQKLPK